MKIHDITLTISPAMPVWPGDPPVTLEQIESMDRGAHANVTRLDMSAHTGTHVDAPHHFLNDGRTVENLPLDVLTGPALVVQLPNSLDLITAAALEAASIPAGTERLLLRTRNSDLWARRATDFFPSFVGISADGAEWLVRRGLRLVGIDYLSVAPFQQSEPTHRILLAAGIVLLEGADLHTVPPGAYDLYCLPLKLLGSDGAPARAVLVEK
ncbi:MAG: putative metal-dependent hydrolase [Anaerolineaceae bacterium]|nr:MAG: putative metal-dependent hydrolase [Anaerolineaceae bacterium]